ncbi:MAG: hypothetical protein D6704_08965 [Nitrospirae bacterium]|nr:MAG: hypothetical protein D6704_08965 [Nitrospirota bacterium]
MGIYEQIQAAFQDIAALELKALRSEAKSFGTKLTGWRSQINTVRVEHAEIRWFNEKLESSVRRLTSGNSPVGCSH